MSGTHLRVGLMLLAGIGLAVGLVLFLGRNRVIDGISFETYFSESVQGLDVGSPVKFRGVQLGQVTEIGLVAATYRAWVPRAGDPDSRMVVTRFKVDRAKLGRLPDTTADAVAAGLRVRLAAQGITGLAYLELDFVDPARFPPWTPPWGPQFGVIPSMPSTISQFQDAAQALAAKLQGVDIEAVAQSLQVLLDTAQAQLMGGELQQTLAEAATLMRTLREGTQAADIAGLAGEVRDAVAALRGLAGGPQTRDLVNATTRSAERLAEATARLPGLLAALEVAVRRANHGTADAQAELLPTLRDARAAAASLRDVSENLRRYPAGTLLGGPPPRERP